MDVSKGLMKMWEKKDVREREVRDAFRNNSFLQRLNEEIKEKARMTAIAVIFIGTILAIELCIVGLCYVACGR